MPKKVVHKSNKGLKKIEVYGGSLLILAILIYPFFFYVQRGIAYMPSWQYLAASAIAAVILIYSYLLILSIKSIGKVIVVLVLFVCTILISLALFALFTPIINYVLAQAVDKIVCGQLGDFTKNLPKMAAASIQEACTQASFKTFFGQFLSR